MPAAPSVRLLRCGNANCEPEGLRVYLAGVLAPSDDRELEAAE